MLKIKTFVFNPFSENTYIAWDTVSNESIVIDPGCYEKYEENEISEFITSNNLLIKYIINTHCHLDHICGNAYFKGKYDSILLIPELEVALLKGAKKYAAMFGVDLVESPQPDNFLRESEPLKIGNIEIRLIFTPGHTIGEFCLYIESFDVVFTGDVLFQRSIGRTDLEGGDFDTLLNSIKNKLLTLPGDVKIYPGHGKVSTIRNESLTNPFLT